MKQMALLAAVAVTLLASAAGAANYYVDNAATGSNNGTSWANAWTSFSNINWTSINPGDTIYVSGGSTSKTYMQTLNIGKSGSSGSPIKLSKGLDAGHNGKVIISPGSGNRGVYGNGYDYISIDGVTANGIEITNFTDGIATGTTSLFADYWTIKNVLIHGGTGDGIFFTEGGGHLVQNSEIYNLTGQGGIMGHAIGVEFGANKGAISTIENSKIYSTAEDGIRVLGENIIIRNNEIHDFANQSAHPDGIQSGGYWKSQVDYTNNIEIYGNKIWNANQLITFEGGDNVKIYNNLLYRESNFSAVKTYGIHLSKSQVGPSPMKNIYLYGNTFGLMDWWAIWVNDYGGCTNNLTNIQVKNNIFYHQSYDGAQILSVECPLSNGLVFNNNTYHRYTDGDDVYYVGGGYIPFTTWKQTYGQEAQGVEVDPLLVHADSAPYDFHLSSSSPSTVTQGGADLSGETGFSGLTQDLEGNTRTVPWSMGAYEYGGQPPSCTDSDGDGYGSPASSLCTYPQRDCDDSNQSIHPGATETCNNKDDDCDGSTDEGFDADGDGYTTCSSPPDCNDNDSSIYSNAAEKCGDGIDQDCTAGDKTCTTCSQGAIPATGCKCGTTNYYSGYCCDGSYQTTSCTGADYFWIEAEAGTITSPMTKGTDSTASGGQYIYSPTAYSGTADYSFNASGGEYIVWALSEAGTPTPDAHNSLYVLMDGSGEDIWDMFFELDANPPTTWTWDQISARGTGTYNNNQYNPRKFTLTAGNHTLRFRGRETDSKIDRLLITNDLSYSPTCTDSDGDGYGAGCTNGPDCNDADASVHATISCTYNGSSCGQYSLCALSCPQPPAENCSDSVDNDCDSLVDCLDSDCSSNANCIGCPQGQIKCNNVCTTIICSVSADCDDTNALTTDSCNNGGLCNASCSNIPCTVRCSSNAECNDSNPLTSDVCINAETCNSSCSNTPYASCGEIIASNCSCGGNIYSTGLCCNNSYKAQATCSTDSQCDDQNTQTNDTCLNAGTCSAACQNTPVSQPVCTAGQTNVCVTEDSCTGTRTCSNNAWGSCEKDYPDCPIIPICTEGQTASCTTTDGCSGTRTCASNTWTSCAKLDSGCPAGGPTDFDADNVASNIDCNDRDARIGLCTGCAACSAGKCVAGSCPTTFCSEKSDCVGENYYSYPSSVPNECIVQGGLGTCSIKNCIPNISLNDERCTIPGQVTQPPEAQETITLQVLVIAMVLVAIGAIAIVWVIRKP